MKHLYYYGICQTAMSIPSCFLAHGAAHTEILSPWPRIADRKPLITALPTTNNSYTCQLRRSAAIGKLSLLDVNTLTALRIPEHNGRHEYLSNTYNMGEYAVTVIIIKIQHVDKVCSRLKQSFEGKHSHRFYAAAQFHTCADRISTCSHKHLIAGRRIYRQIFNASHCQLRPPLCGCLQPARHNDRSWRGALLAMTRVRLKQLMRRLFRARSRPSHVGPM